MIRLTQSRGAMSLRDGTLRRSEKSRMRLRWRSTSMAATPTYCENEVARAAPATPHPSPKMKMMSIVKFAMLAMMAEYNGVLHQPRHL